MTLTILVASWAASAYLAIALFVANIFIRDTRATGMSWLRSVAAGIVMGLAWPVFAALGFILEDA